MRNFSKFEGKLIRMNKSYPIYNDDDDIVGYTEVGEYGSHYFCRN